MKPFMIGRYKATAVIGRGGMATVYRAYDSHFDREVAIKVLPREFLNDSTFRARFQREAKIIGSLEHGAIVPVHDFGEEKGQPYLVMRLMTGGSLADKILAEPLSLVEAARIISAIAPALDEAHVKGVVHRDLKPGNILFDQHDEPYLADFGIARKVDSSTLTGPSVTVGTPAYMSPEQGRGDPGVDGQSDIYSLGAILFEMLSGRVPYEGETPTGQIIRHITDPIPNILDICRDLPQDCQQVINRAMAKKKEDRYTTVVEMAHELTAISQGVPIGRKSRKPLRVPARTPAVRKTLMAKPTDHPSNEKRLPIWAWAGGGVLLLLLLLAGFRWLIYPAVIVKPQPSPSFTVEITKSITPLIIAFTVTPQPSATKEIVAAHLTSSFTPKPSLSTTPTPIPSTTHTPTRQATYTATSLPIAFVSIDVAHLRSGPSEVYAIVANLPKGTELRVEGRNEAGDWLKVTLQNMGGWLALKTVDISVDISMLPVISAPPTPTSTQKPEIIPTSTRKSSKPKENITATPTKAPKP